MLGSLAGRRELMRKFGLPVRVLQGSEKMPHLLRPVVRHRLALCQYSTPGSRATA